MRVGLVDLGTNSVRYDIYEMDRHGHALLLYSEKEMIRLGENLFSRGRLHPRAVNRLIHSFREYNSVTRELEVSKIVAFATSALREAKDKERVRKRVQRETGIALRVISGKEEARLIAQGILANEPPRRGEFAIIDIGGGSTEIILCERKKVLAQGSFRLGVARVQEVYLKSIPPRNIDDAFRYVEKILKSAKARALSETGATEAIGSSGTVKALSRILKRMDGECFIQRESLSYLRSRMSTMNRNQLLHVPGMTDKRVDLILAGAIILEATMKTLGIERITPTVYALRDGILEEVKKKLRSH